LQWNSLIRICSSSMAWWRDDIFLIHCLISSLMSIQFESVQFGSFHLISCIFASVLNWLNNREWGLFFQATRETVSLLDKFPFWQVNRVTPSMFTLWYPSFFRQWISSWSLIHNVCSDAACSN
jgi:hypothetical protein